MGQKAYLRIMSYHVGIFLGFFWYPSELRVLPSVSAQDEELGAEVLVFLDSLFETESASG